MHLWHVVFSESHHPLPICVLELSQVVPSWFPVLSESLEDIVRIRNEGTLGQFITWSQIIRRRNCAHIFRCRGNGNQMLIMHPNGVKMSLYIFAQMNLLALLFYSQNGVALILPESSDAWSRVITQVIVKSFHRTHILHLQTLGTLVEMPFLKPSEVKKKAVIHCHCDDRFMWNLCGQHLRYSINFIAPVGSTMCKNLGRNLLIVWWPPKVQCGRRQRLVCLWLLQLHVSGSANDATVETRCVLPPQPSNWPSELHLLCWVC